MIIHKKEINMISFSLVAVLAVAFAFIIALLNEKNLLNPGCIILTASLMAGIYYFIEFMRQF